MSDIAVHITALILITLLSGGLGLLFGLTRGVGPMGPIGIQGSKGDNGPMGIKGPKGDRGYPGSNYATGESNNE
jgi:hypothetical protein